MSESHRHWRARTPRGWKGGCTHPAHHWLRLLSERRVQSLGCTGKHLCRPGSPATYEEMLANNPRLTEASA